jgi:hypothetical protein
MIKHKLVKIMPKLPETQKEIKNNFGGDFLKYLEHILDKYVNDGWDIVSPNVYANGFGAEIGALFIFKKEQ